MATQAGHIPIVVTRDREGTLRAFSLEEDGHYHDSAIFGLLRTEWPAPRD